MEVQLERDVLQDTRYKDQGRCILESPHELSEAHQISQVRRWPSGMKTRRLWHLGLEDRLLCSCKKQELINLSITSLSQDKNLCCESCFVNYFFGF